MRRLSVALLVAVAAGSAARPADFRVSGATTGVQSQPDLAVLRDGTAAVAWRDSGEAPPALRARWLRPVGTPSSGNFYVGDDDDSDPSSSAIGAGGAGFVVAWVADRTFFPNVRAQRLDGNGDLLGGELEVAAPAGIEDDPAPGVAVHEDGSFVVVWSGSPAGDADPDVGVHARRYDATGTPLGAAFLVNTTTAGNQGRPVVAALPDGGFVVAWPDDPSDPDLPPRWRRFGPGGEPYAADAELLAPTDGVEGRLRIGADALGGFAAAWEVDGGEEIWARSFAPDGTPAGAAFELGSGEAVAVALEPAGGVLTTWSGSVDGDTRGIAAQRFAGDGTPDGAAFRVNTYTTGDQDRPVVEIDRDGDGLVVWESPSFTDDPTAAVVGGRVAGPIAARWRFDEGGGDDSVDSARLTADELTVVEASWVPGPQPRSATAVQLDGFDDWLDVSNGADSTSPARRRRSRPGCDSTCCRVPWTSRSPAFSTPARTSTFSTSTGRRPSCVSR